MEIYILNIYAFQLRTAGMDIRNTRNLILDNIRLGAEFPDEREWYRLENCDCLKENIFIEK